MSEEKDLNEAFEDNDEVLSDFVDFADLNELDGMDSSTLFGDLGDIADLGDVPEFVEAMPAADGDSESEESMPVLDEMNDIADLDSLLADLDAPDASQKENIENVSLEASMEEELPLLDENAEEVPGVEEMETEIEEDFPADVPLEMPGEDLSVDALMEDSLESSPIDALLEESSGETLSLDGLMDALQEGASDEEAVEELMDLDSMFDESKDSLSMENFSAGIDAIADGAASMPDGMALEESAEAMVLDDSADGGILDGLDLGFSMDDSTEESADISAETTGIDSMLDGLLGDLDMAGTLDESTAQEEESTGDALADLLGLDDGNFDDSDSDLDEFSSSMLGVENMVPKEEEEQKPGFFKRIFGNIITDEIAKQEREAAQKAEEDAILKQEEEAKAQEEKEALKAEKEEEKAAKKEEQRKIKEAKKAEKAAKKAEKQAQREAEEAAELEVVGKLNRVGVSIIVIATVIFLGIEIAGTNVFGYISARDKANNYFEMGKYTEAYQEAIGTDMREKDKEDYDKIRVVMKVQQCLNAYKNYDRIKYYPEAVDALLRGIKRYDIYIKEATALEVEKDMLSCRKQILTILQSEFAISESQAYEILALEKAAYTDRVVEIGISSK